MKRNNVSSRAILNVLRTANSVINLKQTFLNLKTEIEKLNKQSINIFLWKMGVTSTGSVGLKIFGFLFIIFFVSQS
jgi:hypothetical protein